MQGKRMYGSKWGPNIGPTLIPREKNVLVQKRWEFGSMTRGCECKERGCMGPAGDPI